MPDVHIVVDEDLKAAIDAQAAREQRTLKVLLTRAIEEYLEAHGPEMETAR
jgi:predicted transcriptional regulator